MILKCKQCGVDFETTHKNRACCSRECSNRMRFPKVEKPCLCCNKIILDKPNGSKKYCSVHCKNEHQKEILVGPKNPNYKGEYFHVSCSCCGDVFKVREYEKFNSDGSKKKNMYCSTDCKGEHQKEMFVGSKNPNYNSVEVNCKNCGKKFEKKFSRVFRTGEDFCSQLCKGEKQKELTGNKNPNYKHGLSDEYRRERRFNPEYIKWKIDVLEKYGRSCVICKSKDNVQAHHLYSFDRNENKRTDLNNGVALCKEHHTDFHKRYGFGNNTKEQFDEYLKLD